MATYSAPLPGRTMSDDRARRFPWWIFLITATAWLIISIVVLRFNSTSVAAIATLAGIVIILAGVAELVNGFTAPGWRWLHLLLGTLFVILGIVALFHPGSTFLWLSAFIGWYLLFKGIFDIVLAFATKDENDAWWLGLIVGIIEVALGFWAAGNFFRKAYLLIVLVGIIALTHAITDVVLAFRIRRLEQEI